MTQTVYLFCGGASSRMKRDKALLPVNEKNLLEYQLEKLDPVFGEVVLLSGPKSYGVQRLHLADSVPGAGPLGGLLAAMVHASAQGKKAALVLPVDLPFLQTGTLKRLALSAAELQAETVTLQSERYTQPLAGAYHVGLISVLRQFLENGNRKVVMFTETLHSAALSVKDDELINLNTPEEWERWSGTF